MRRSTLCAVLMTMVWASSAHAAPTWLSSFPLGFDAYYVAIGSDGTTVYYGEPDTTGTGHYRDAVQVRPPGGPLGPVQYLSADGVSPTLLSVVAGPDGRMAAGWVEGGVLEVAVMQPGATSFDAPSPVLTSGDAPQATPALAIDAAGNVLVLFTSSSSGIQYVRYAVRAPGAGTVTSTVLDSVSPPASGFASIFALSVRAADSGAAIAAWDQQTTQTSPSTTSTDNIKVALRPAGQAFGAPTSVATGTNGDTYSTQTFLGWPAIAMTPGGQGALVWTARTEPGGGGSSSCVVRFRTASPGSALGSVLEPSGTTSTFDSNAMVGLGPDGRAFVGWTGTSGSTTRLIVAVREAGAPSFGALQPLGSGADPTTYDDLEVSRTGEAVAAWSAYNTGTGLSTVQAALAPAGGFFGAAKTLGSGYFSLSPGPHALLDAAGDGVALVRSYNQTDHRYESSAIGLDGSAPQLTNLQIPANGTIGDPLAFAVTATDVWEPVTTHWDFGDGSAADGASASHAYQAAGTDTVTVTATDSLGNATTATSPVAIAAPPGTGGSGTEPGTSESPVPDTTPPLVSALALTNRVFAVARQPTAIVARRRATIKRGTVLRYTLSEASAVTLTFQHRVRVRVHHHTHLRWTGGGKLTRHGTAGANRVAFSGRIGKRALAPGTWRVVLKATDATGNVSKTARIGFRIVRG